MSNAMKKIRNTVFLVYADCPQTMTRQGIDLSGDVRVWIVAKLLQTVRDREQAVSRYGLAASAPWGSLKTPEEVIASIQASGLLSRIDKKIVK